ncbi:MAG: hydrogenase maturation protease [Polyangiaceae bacterium]|nr:hydrogenase maturation protease [Polyangiaceae bacterium]
MIGFGNPGRLDDGLGPALAARVEAAAIPGVTVDSDYQLQVEDAEAVSHHDVVVFADAAISGREPFSVSEVVPSRGLSFSSHSVDPDEILGLARDLFHSAPRAFMLAIRGYDFDEFGERLSPDAADNLAAAEQFLLPILIRSDLAALAERAQAAAPPFPNSA